MVLNELNYSPVSSTQENFDRTKDGDTTQSLLENVSIHVPAFPSPDVTDECLEVNYHASTSLYMSIEDCDWEALPQKCKESPEQVRTWVVSGGEDESFIYCVWRRLPIHEACRRQPPVHAIRALLKAFPESAFEKTQFGELPLHLAAGCGANSDVVNLLLAYNPWAVIAKDNGGRTALEIIRDGAWSDESNVIDEALVICEKNVEQRNRQIGETMARLKHDHSAEVTDLKQQSEYNMKVKESRISQLQHKLQKSKGMISEMLKTLKVCETKVVEKNRTESKLMKRITDLENDNVAVRSECQELKGKLSSAEEKRDENRKKIGKINNAADVHLSEMQNVLREKDEMIAKSQALENEAMILLEKQRQLNMELQRQREVMNALNSKTFANIKNISNIGDDEAEETYEADHGSMSGDSAQQILDGNLGTPSPTFPPLMPSLSEDDTEKSVLAAMKALLNDPNISHESASTMAAHEEKNDSLSINSSVFEDGLVCD